MCGAELLLVPDLNSMSQAIESHVAEHVNKLGLSLTEEDANLIREQLITKVLQKACK